MKAPLKRSSISGHFTLAVSLEIRSKTSTQVEGEPPCLGGRLAWCSRLGTAPRVVNSRRRRGMLNQGCLMSACHADYGAGACALSLGQWHVSAGPRKSSPRRTYQGFIAHETEGTDELDWSGVE